MSRLIEAETLKASVRAKFQNVADRCEINELINAALTVDAIPVEWLEAQIMPYNGDAGDVGFTVYNVTIKNLIRKWHAEQEANTDG